MTEDVTAIVVSFNPEVDRLSPLLDLLTKEVRQTVVVDNGSSPEIVSWLSQRASTEQIQLIGLTDNFGIGYAQNRAIEFAMEGGNSKLLFLDQDSLPLAGMVATLASALDHLLQDGVQVGAVAPVRNDENDPSPTFFRRFDRFPPRKISCTGGRSQVEADVLISSGMLVPVKSFKEVGLMEEGLFVDQVDTEWCLRARVRGYRFFGICNARLRHKLGNRVARFWLGHTHTVPVHPPIRNYYFVRNSIVLTMRGYVPRIWKWHMIWSLLKFTLRYGLTSPRGVRLLMMAKGVLHAFAGRLGRMP